MALTVYGTPGARSTTPMVARPMPSRRRDDDEDQRRIAPVASRVAQSDPELAALLKPRQAQPKADSNGGLAQGFFNSGIGRGVGTIINNPVVKAALQPLDLLGVPQRAVASTLQEAYDAVGGEGFSGSDWLEQVNPLYAFHGEGGEKNIGMGDVWRDMAPTLAGKNRWLDAGIGFGLDVATDPLTYVAGLGIADKGLDAARSGTRLGAAVSRQGDDALRLARAQEAAAKAGQSPALVAGAREASAELIGRSGRTGTRSASLVGRPTRNVRISEAKMLVDRADADALAKLYGFQGDGAQFVRAIDTELANRAGKGLGATSLKASDPVREVVETALNIKPPATTFRPTGTRLGFTERPAEAMARALGGPRQRFNTSRLGSSIIDARAPLDYQGQFRQLAKGSKMSPDELAGATQSIRFAERGRPNKGEFLNIGQRAVSAERDNIIKEIREIGGGRASSAKVRQAYTQASELPAKMGGRKTALNRLFGFARTVARDRFGVDIPELAGELDYLPHVPLPKFADDVIGNQTYAKQFSDATGVTPLDLISDTSGRLRSRQILPNIDIPLPNGEVINTGRGTIDDINRAAIAKGYGPLLETDPILLVDSYFESLAEDIGRRGAQAEMTALGETGFAPNLLDFDEVLDEATGDLVRTPTVNVERATEARDMIASAVERIRRQENPNFSPRIEPSALDALIQQPDVDRIVRLIADGRLPDLLDAEFEKWSTAGTNQAIAMSPEVRQRMHALSVQARKTSLLAQMYRQLNSSFKTFAVLTPGFHVRNHISAVFMNFADGVTAESTLWGHEWWDKYEKESRKSMEAGLKWVDAQPADVQEAFRAVFASGAGGRFTEQGVREGGGVLTFLDKMTNNPLTRKSQEFGARVEGSVRLGMARDTLLNGGSQVDATSRITRIHFDYGQLSPFDERAKSIVPFWSFVSRNTPMQVMQQWSRPQTYNRYEMFRNNFAQDDVFGDDEEVPGYIASGRGIPMNLPGFNWFEPDLAHTRVSEDIERLGNITSDPAGMLSNVTPFISAPLEFAFKRDAFTGQTFGPDDWEEINPLTAIATLPAALLTGGEGVRWGADGKVYIKSEVLNAIEATQPLLARSSRISGSGSGEGRQLETIARLFGAPVRNITDRQLNNQQLSEWFDAQDQQRILQATGG
jgi:hypothetical protein